MKYCDLFHLILAMYCDGWDPVNKGVITCVPPSDQVPGDGDRWRVGTVCTLKCERPDYNVKTFSTSRCVGKDDWNIKTLCCVGKYSGSSLTGRRIA